MGDFVEGFSPAIPLVAEHVQNVRVPGLFTALDAVPSQGVDGACREVA
jgi:hypothetical protein